MEEEREDSGINLDELLSDVTPSLVTPHLVKIMEANSKARPKLIAQYIIRGMAKSTVPSILPQQNLLCHTPSCSCCFVL